LDEFKFGIKGVLAYAPRLPFENGIGPLDPRVGYMGHSDYAFLREGRTFAVAELKMVKDENESAWYLEGAIAPQIICWLGGTVTCRVGLVLTNKGLKLLYRKLKSITDPAGNPVFDYFMFPPDDTFDLFKGTNRMQALWRLVRIVFEIVMCTRIPDGISNDIEPPSLKKLKISPPTPTDSENHENVEAQTVEQIEVISSYSCSVTDKDGSLTQIEGYELEGNPSDEFTDIESEHSNSESDSD
jgi:hypothetical protein